MRIPKRDIPQADKLEDVLKVVDLVFLGTATTFQDIAKAIGKSDRQGRYYRRAAEILGLLTESGGANQSSLTDLGLKYARAGIEKKKTISRQAIISTRIFQRVIPFLESRLPAGCPDNDFKKFLDSVTEPTGKTMMPRRASTLIGWLQSVGIVERNQNRIMLTSLPINLCKIHHINDAEPLLPSKFTLSEYQDVQTRISQGTDTMSYIVDKAKLERAVKSHDLLTNLVASKIRDYGEIPRCNNLVDVAARIDGIPYIFEIKSSSEMNARTQVRRGISQLYEYRYLQSIPDAKLVLVIEKPLPKECEWMSDYIIHDRNILFVWDGDKKNLYCHQILRKHLEFLVT